MIEQGAYSIIAAGTLITDNKDKCTSGYENVNTLFNHSGLSCKFYKNQLETRRVKNFQSFIVKLRHSEKHTKLEKIYL